MIYLILTFFFILSQSFFSGMETGMISLLKPRVLHAIENGDKAAKILLFFMERPPLLLATTLLGTNICVACSSNMAKNVVISFGFSGETAFFLTGCIMSIILMNAEIIPKDWFRQYPYKRTRIFAHIFKFVYYLLYIPSNILAFYTNWINKLAKREESPKDMSSIMRKDFILLLRESEKAGVIDKSLSQIIDRSLYIQNLKAEDFMIKKENVVQIEADKTLKEAYDLFQKTKISRILIVSTENKEKWAGFISIYDAIFDTDEKLWDKIKVSDMARTLTEILPDEKIIKIIENSSKISAPIVTVKENKSGMHVGIVDLFDISQKLFGF